ncbi:MAG: tetratricopeptide repeat protein [Treponema sp.]|nr:tetratricopeptide repeat protein [Treponema sp.]
MKAMMLAVITLIFCSCGGKGDAISTDPQTLRLYANAHELYSNGQFPEAVALLEELNNFTPALMLRGKAQYFSGDYARAEKSLDRVIKLRPGNFDAKLYIARILRERGESEKAQRLTEELLADNPHDVRVLRFAASLAMEQGDPAGALALLDQAAELTADGAMALLERARIRWIAGKGDEALEDLSRARAMLPWETPIARSINQLESRITEAMQ